MATDKQEGPAPRHPLDDRAADLARKAAEARAAHDPLAPVYERRGALAEREARERRAEDTIRAARLAGQFGDADEIDKVRAVVAMADAGEITEPRAAYWRDRLAYLERITKGDKPVEERRKAEAGNVPAIAGAALSIMLGASKLREEVARLRAADEASGPRDLGLGDVADRIEEIAKEIGEGVVSVNAALGLKARERRAPSLSCPVCGVSEGFLHAPGCPEAGKGPAVDLARFHDPKGV